MYYLKLLPIAALLLLSVQSSAADGFYRVEIDRTCSVGWNERRAMRKLFPGRMQLTLGDMHRRHWRERCLAPDRLPERTIPSWSRRYDPHGRFAGYFYGFNDIYGPGRPILRPRYGIRSFHWRPERRRIRKKAASRIYPSHDARAAHLAWCHSKYRSFRASDNTFQPYRGARKRCVSPYGR
ncbi:BA14K family protein [uncultured Nitratireductor sp.]|uniref:BA14K family protein n=1 Tax=uncultured Nitratireductor sp. TaxID=520953 RepID=UPI0025F7C54A|nr:BA14K family protein [uncultured Nitratireductor sp.]